MEKDQDTLIEQSAQISARIAFEAIARPKIVVRLLVIKHAKLGRGHV